MLPPLLPAAQGGRGARSRERSRWRGRGGSRAKEGGSRSTEGRGFPGSRALAGARAPRVASLACPGARRRWKKQQRLSGCGSRQALPPPSRRLCTRNCEAGEGDRCAARPHELPVQTRSTPMCAGSLLMCKVTFVVPQFLGAKSFLACKT